MFEKFFCPKVDGFISLSNNIMCNTRLLECAKAKSSPDTNLKVEKNNSVISVQINER